MENARRWLRRATLSSFSYSPVRIRSLFFSRRPFPERELGVTNQPTCFTFKSSCPAISNRVHRNGVCTHYDSLLEMYNFPREMPVSASSVSRDLGPASRGRSGMKAAPAWFGSLDERNGFYIVAPRLLFRRKLNVLRPKAKTWRSTSGWFTLLWIKHFRWRKTF